MFVQESWQQCHQLQGVHYKLLSFVGFILFCKMHYKLLFKLGMHLLFFIRVSVLSFDLNGLLQLSETRLGMALPKSGRFPDVHFIGDGFH